MKISKILLNGEIMNWVIQMIYNLFTIFAMSSKCDHSFSKATYNIAAWRINLNGENIEAKKALRSSVILDVIKLSTPVWDYKR